MVYLLFLQLWQFVFNLLQPSTYSMSRPVKSYICRELSNVENVTLVDVLRMQK